MTTTMQTVAEHLADAMHSLALAAIAMKAVESEDPSARLRNASSEIAGLTRRVRDQAIKHDGPEDERCHTDDRYQAAAEFEEIFGW